MDVGEFFNCFPSSRTMRMKMRWWCFNECFHLHYLHWLRLLHSFPLTSMSTSMSTPMTRPLSTSLSISKPTKTHDELIGTQSQHTNEPTSAIQLTKVITIRPATAEKGKHYPIVTEQHCHNPHAFDALISNKDHHNTTNNNNNNKNKNTVNNNNSISSIVVWISLKNAQRLAAMHGKNEHMDTNTHTDTHTEIPNCNDTSAHAITLQKEATAMGTANRANDQIDSRATALSEHMVSHAQIESLANIASHRNVKVAEQRQTNEVKDLRPSHEIWTSTEEHLYHAAQTGDVIMMRQLLSQNDASISRTCCHPHHGVTPLQVAASNGHFDACAMLIQAGFHVNDTSANGSTALHHAALAGHAEIVQLLLAWGADPSIMTSTWTRNTFGKDSGQLALHWAASASLRHAGHDEVIRLLLEIDPIGAAISDERGRTAACLAEAELNFEIAKRVREKQNEQLFLMELRTELIFRGPLAKP